MTENEQIDEPISSNTLDSSKNEKSEKSEWEKISLESTLTLPQLMDFKEQLHQYHGSRVQLNGEKVERIDTAALQLLLAFINSPDVTVGWIEPSKELCKAASLLGLNSHLGLSSCHS
ncbi:STAS domain-containing protein [Candidatus Marithioploca araucensis]|jgi:ABC-type transporter Mla MlaB component|uniref:STAS domain-containing protein n=1 Tax=Candidatus Marithioploca araucensis TaxID=70273 RepID=A0ABT7VRB0_9GAMM|nr:STAS domain-containing protein [Candidatus Marithioploca araucensis]